MKSSLKNKIAIFTISAVSALPFISYADSVPENYSHKLNWKLGMELSGSYVPGTNAYLKGANFAQKDVNASFAASLRSDFSFSPYSKEGMIYKGLYQGFGVDIRSFFADRLLGSPYSVYVFQGAPVINISDRLSLDYEWKFGAAFGWKHYYNGDNNNENTAISTPVTAHMALGLKFRYDLTPQIKLSAGLEATHFSNGNTSSPNGGINTLGVALGVAYYLDTTEQPPVISSAEILDEADKPKWFYDITLFGGWRKRGMILNDTPLLCPGKFGVAGMQAGVFRKINRWFASGASVDFLFDESAGLKKYWVDGTYGDEVKFYRPPFGKQISLGLSAHAQLTAPIFTIDAGIGYDFLKPDGDKRFYQSLTLKTFLTDWLYLNVGYRLGNFNDPQNLMLGFGFHL